MTIQFISPEDIDIRSAVRERYGSIAEKAVEVEAMMWILNFSDGEHDLIDIIEKSGIDYKIILKEMI